MAVPRVEDLHGSALPGGGPGPEPPVSEDADGTVHMALPAQNSSVTHARRFVQRRWPDLGELVLDDLCIIVSELVSNAVVHGRPDIEMQLRIVPTGVDVAVLDHNPALPSPPDAAPAATKASGRGLLLVDQLAHRWGVVPLADGTGKTVWASVETS